jgi:hypothetical protein
MKSGTVSGPILTPGGSHSFFLLSSALCWLQLDMKLFLSVEFLLVEGNKVVPSQLDAPAILLLETSCSAIRLAARSEHHYFVM